MIAGPKVTERDNIILLVDDQHREGADDVETGHHEDKREEDIGNKLLYLHDLEGVVLLFKTVLHGKTITTEIGNLRLGTIEIAARLEPQLQRREHALLVEDATGKGDTRQDIVLIVSSLLHIEKHTGRVELVFLESLFGSRHIKLSLTAGGIDLQRILVCVSSG